MSNSCRITPHVKNSSGQEVESKLYNDLKGLMTFIGKGGRANVLPLYQKTLNPQFTKDMEDKGATFDENGEVSLYDFWNLTDISQDISRETILNYLNFSNDFIKNGSPVEYSKHDAFDKIEDFNSSPWSKQFTAKLKRSGKKFTISIEPLDTDYKLQSTYFGRLSKRLTQLLEGWGVGIDELTDLESRFTNGYTDFSNNLKLPNGLIGLIKLAKGKAGRKALPEEFSHLVVRSLKNTPLIVRALNQLKQNDIYKAVLGDSIDIYRHEYYDNPNNHEQSLEDYLAEEALGHILADKIENVWVETHLIDRIFNTFKNIFNKYDENKINQIVLECDKDLNILANNLLNGSYTNLDIKNLGTSKFNQFHIKYQKTKTAWDNFYETMVRTSAIYTKRAKELGIASNQEDKLEFEGNQTELLQKLDIAAHHDWIKPYEERRNGIVTQRTKEEFRLNTAVSLIGFALQNMKSIQQKVNELRQLVESGSYKGNWNKACALIKSVGDYIAAYEQILHDFDDVLQEASNDPVLATFPEIDRIKSELSSQAKELEELMKELKNDTFPSENNIKDRTKKSYKHPLALQVLIQAFQQLVPEQMMLHIGTNFEGEILTLEEMLLFSDEDISVASAWLNSMANTSDPILRMYDAVVKKQKDIARQECIDIQRTIKAAGKKLEKFGFSLRDHSWAYARYENDVIDDAGNVIHNAGDVVVDNQGNPKYITPYDEEAAIADFKRYKNELKNDNTLSDEEKLNKLKEFKEERWVERKGEIFPKEEYYPSKEWQALTNEQREFMTTFFDCKRRLDKWIPLYTGDSTKAIIVRKSGLQRLFSAFKLNKTEFDAGIMENIKDALGDLTKRKDTDEEFGETSILMNLQGKEVKKIPIYHTSKSINTKISSLSHNLVANMCIYAQTATNYKAMAQIINILELGKDALSFRQTVKRDGIKALFNPVKHNKNSFKTYLYLDGDKTNWSKRLDNYLDMQVYGRLKVGEISKTADLFGRAVGLFTTAVNILVGITNILQGLSQINIEMFAGEHFTMGDLIKAKYYYWKNILPVIVDSQKMIKDSKLSLLSEDFNVMQEFERNTKDMGQYEKNPLYRNSLSSTLYLLNHIGEHYMQHITFLAMMYHEKVYNQDGIAVNMLDLFEVKPLDSSNKSLGSYLSIKKYKHNGYDSQVYKTKDGQTIVTMEQLKARQQGTKYDLYSPKLLHDNEIAEYDFKHKLSRKSAKLNQDMHGIYNEDDRNQLQQKAWGGLFMMYRKHIMPNLMKRWKQSYYDADLDTFTTGFQRTLLFNKIFSTKLDEVTGNRKWALISTWTPQERRNLMRNLGQMFNWVTNNLFITLLENCADDDDDLWIKLLLISAYRNKTENSPFELLSLLSKHNLLKEWLRLADQPVVGTSIVEKYSNLFSLLDPSVYVDEVKSGPYKGKKKAVKVLYECVPTMKQFISFKDPDKSLQYYRRDVGESFIISKIMRND
jgi:hypothetical protein